jgi:aspartate aminotransferase
MSTAAAHRLISQRLNRVKPSPTLVISDRARAMKAAGIDVIALSQGEPDMDTPKHIGDAGVAAITQGQTRYTLVNGTLPLRQAIAAKLARDHDMQVDPNHIIVGTGGKQVLFNAFLATLNEGDEVLIPAPYWVSYPDMVHLAGGVSVSVACPETQGFKLTADLLSAAITPRTRWLLLNSPSNPTGAVYSKAELQALAQVLKAHPDILVMSDDMYEKLLFDGMAYSTMAQAAPEIADRVLTVNGVSKAYCMTGWRIGYGHGPAWLIDAMSTIQSQSTSNPSSVSQAAATVALNGPQDFIADHNTVFKRRRDLVVDLLNDCRGLHCPLPQGAFYVYPNCGQTLGKTTAGGKLLKDDFDFANALLDEQQVAVVPGQAFGLSPYFRISYATSDEVLKRACERINVFCAGLK